MLSPRYSAFAVRPRGMVEWHRSAGKSCSQGNDLIGSDHLEGCVEVVPVLFVLSEALCTVCDHERQEHQGGRDQLREKSLLATHFYSLFYGFYIDILMIT